MSETIASINGARLVGSSLTADGHVSDWFGMIMFEAAEASGKKGDLTEARIRIYAADLAEYAPEDVVRAIRRARREGKGFFVSIAEIIQQLGPSADDAALLAWSGLCQATEQVGAYQSIQIDDWCAAEALRRTAGGWAAFCGIDEGPAKAMLRQQFLACYRQVRRECAPDAPPQILIGLSGPPPNGKEQAVWAGRLTDRYEVMQVRAAELDGHLLAAGAARGSLTEGADHGEA